MAYNFFPYFRIQHTYILDKSNQTYKILIKITFPILF